jgi:hypothetical protein
MNRSLMAVASDLTSQPRDKKEVINSEEKATVEVLNSETVGVTEFSVGDAEVSVGVTEVSVEVRSWQENSIDKKTKAQTQTILI